jgi:hypothetical protein
MSIGIHKIINLIDNRFIQVIKRYNYLLFKKFDVLIESIMSICKGLYLAFLFVSQGHPLYFLANYFASLIRLEDEGHPLYLLYQQHT